MTPPAVNRVLVYRGDPHVPVLAASGDAARMELMEFGWNLDNILLASLLPPTPGFWLWEGAIVLEVVAGSLNPEEKEPVWVGTWKKATREVCGEMGVIVPE